MTDLTLTQNQREAALVAMRTAYWECESGRSVIESILDALLAIGWRPEPQPDAIAAAEARGYARGVEAAAQEIEPSTDMTDDELSQYGKDKRRLAARIRAISPIPKEPDHGNPNA